MSRNIIALFVIAAFVSLTGCASSTQVATATAVDVADTTDDLTDQQVQELLAAHDTDSDGWAYIPPAGPRVIVGNAHLVFSSEEIRIEGRVVEVTYTSETVRLADGRTLRVERLAGGSVQCTVGNTDCGWTAPRGAAIDSGRLVVPGGVILTLPEPAASSLRTALATR